MVPSRPPEMEISAFELETYEKSALKISVEKHFTWFRKSVYYVCYEIVFLFKTDQLKANRI